MYILIDLEYYFTQTIMYIYMFMYMYKKEKKNFEIRFELGF